MAIVEQTTIESKDGVKKTIDQNSMGMALDILQRGLYAFPIKSTIRELASNAHDAIKERDVAKAIIAGKESVKDHFDESLGEEGIYHTSGWNPDYFDLDWLSDDPYVRLYYEEGKLRDVLRISDNGVGLGHGRLLGYFQLNYSSKRKNKDTLGKYGLGSKVPLSLGIESFRVINRYNGMRFKFDVYLDKIESAISRFGNGGMNKSIRLTQDKIDEDGITHPGYVAYWEPTTEKNGVEIQVQIKKHNRQAFFEAVESQLMYMPNILFLHRELNAITHQEVDIKAKIEYRDENIIISKTTVYNKPHILLGTGDVLINYGFLSFPELELEPKGGAVGLIMDINEIEVTPSREAPIWSTKTRKAILEKYEKVTETATKYVTEEIGNETDYLLWMRKASSIISSIKTGASFGSSETSDALSTLASIIDVSEIKNLKFAPDLRIVLYNEVEKMFGDQFYLRVITFDSWSKKVNRDKSKSINSLIYPIYLTFLGANKYKDRYIYEEKGQFLLITAKEEYKEAKKWKLIDESSIYTLYDSLDVPEDRLALYTQDENDDEDGDDDLATLSTKTRAELRKENKKIVVHYANKDTSGSWVFSARDRSISDMFNLQPGENVMYGTGNDRNIMKTILELLPAYFTGGISSKFYDKSTDSTLTAILVAKENLKYISNSSRFQSVPSIFIDSYDKNTGHLVLASRIQYVITAIFVQLYSESLITDKACSISRIVREGYRSDKLITLLGDTKELKQVCNYLFETVYHVSIISTIKRTAQDVEFIKKLGRLQLIDEKLIDSSEEDRETLITEINDNLPDFLCDDIEEIKTVEALFPDLFKQCVDLIKKINLGWPIISLFIDKYYYRDEDMEHVAEDVKFYLKLKADDASL